MAGKNLHAEPFDEHTLTKLEIFEEYAEAWIPTFIMNGSPIIAIFDLFAGTGYDMDGIAGSPIRILEKINKLKSLFFRKNAKVNLYLNEYDLKKFKLLETSCNDYFNSNKSLNSIVNLKLSQKEGDQAFNDLIGEIKQLPSLVFLDQNGIKFISQKYLNELEKTIKTDFLYFVSSSYFWRFYDTDEYKIHFNFDIDKAREQPYKFIHRSLLDQLRSKLPLYSKLKLYPFTIKKNTNIFGLIFGSKHPLAVDKFLNVVWKKDKIGGQANFDIEDIFTESQLNLFTGPKVTRIESFQIKLKENILNRKVCNNLQALEFAYSEGHIGKHASELIKEMKKEGLIYYEEISPCVTYDAVYKYKTKRTVIFKINETE